jgi:sporadic carbohydrate cluster protein (TIGR04323 family)
MMLEQLVSDIKMVSGLVFYSVEQLPTKIADREKIFCHILNANRSIHFAVEGLSIYDSKSCRRIENIIEIQAILPACPDIDELRLAFNEF